MFTDEINQLKIFKLAKTNILNSWPGSWHLNNFIEKINSNYKTLFSLKIEARKKIHEIIIISQNTYWIIFTKLNFQMT